MSVIKPKPPLPSYVVINDPNCHNKEVLRIPAKPVQFPLNDELHLIAADLEAKYDAEENCAGIAAPQIGYGHQIIIFEVPDDPNLKKFRLDLSDTLPKAMWFNPSYTPVGDTKIDDWEACFSVEGLVGKVSRYEEIRYEAYSREGEKITGRAKGYLARVIQHETDHVHGKLFIDYVSQDELITRAQLKEIRARQLQEKE